MNKKNILIIGHCQLSYIGGAEEYNRKLFRILSKNHNIFLAFTNSQESQKCHEKYNGVPYFDLSYQVEPFNSIFQIPQYIISNKKKRVCITNKIKEIIKLHNINLIINSSFMEIGNYWSKEISIPVIDIQHRDDKIIHKKFFSKKPYDLLVRFLLKNKYINNYFVAFSNESNNKIFSKANNNNKRKWINLACLKQNEMVLSKNKENDVIYVGRIVKGKNIDKLKEVGECLLKRGINLCIYGNDDEHLLRNCNFYKGELNNDEAIAQIKKSSLSILLSESEGMSYFSVESLSCGVPIVLYDTYTLAKYVIGNNERGILINELSVENIVDEICKLLKNKDKYNQMCVNSLEFSKQNLSIETFTKKWVDLINEILHI